MPFIAAQCIVYCSIVYTMSSMNYMTQTKAALFLPVLHCSTKEFCSARVCNAFYCSAVQFSWRRSLHHVQYELQRPSHTLFLPVFHRNAVHIFIYGRTGLLFFVVPVLPPHLYSCNHFKIMYKQLSCYLQDWI